MGAHSRELQAPKRISPSPPSRDPVFEQECVALFSEFLQALGLPKSVGQIYGLLFASPAPLCFSEIVVQLGASKGSVSQGLAFLRRSGAVKSVSTPGERREFFEPELGLRRLAMGLIQRKIEPLARETRGSLARLRQQALVTTGELKDFRIERIEQLETWHRQLGRVIPVVQAVLTISRK